MLKDLNLTTKKTLYVSSDFNENVFMSARNISSVLTTLLSDINTYDLVNSDVLILSESAAKMFTEEEEGIEA
jgi:large subunit ribosomal protein L4